MESNNNRNKLSPAIKATIVFLCAAAALTFFSKTIYNAGIPTVYVSTVKSGGLDVSYFGEGIVVPKEVTDLYAPEDLIITDILVNQYDTVQKGDVLAIFDISDLEDQLLDMETEYEKLLATQNNSHGKERQLLDMDVSDAERHIERLKEKIRHGAKLYAPSNGIVTWVSARTGMLAGQTVPLIKLGKTDQGYVVKQTIDDNNARYYTKAVVYLTGTDANTKLPGRIINKVPSSNGKVDITIELEPERTTLHPDMLVMLELSGRTEDFPAIIPASAIVDDYCVYKLIESDGPLGAENRVRRTDVIIEANNQEFVAIKGEISKGDKVVVRSDKQLSDERVKIGH